MATPGINGESHDGASAIAGFESDSVGTFVLQVVLQLASGQKRIGQARITVVNDLV